MFTVSLLSLKNVYYYDSVYFLSFSSRINPISGIRAICSLIVSQHMSLTRSEYREFGLELVSLDHSRHPKRPPMVEEKRDDGVGDPIKSLLEESLT